MASQLVPLTISLTRNGAKIAVSGADGSQPAAGTLTIRYGTGYQSRGELSRALRDAAQQVDDEATFAGAMAIRRSSTSTRRSVRPSSPTATRVTMFEYGIANRARLPCASERARSGTAAAMGAGRLAVRAEGTLTDLSYHRAYELTFLIQGWLHNERRRSGAATSRFQASQQASTMAA